MVHNRKFDPRHLSKLNDPRRFEYQHPDTIWKALNIEAPRVLVDVGAGTGFYAMPFCDKAEGAVVYACDQSPEMIDWLKANLPKAYENRIIPLLTTENHIPLESGTADLVYMIHLHHELEDPVRMLSEARRLIKPSGEVLIVDWKKEPTPGGPPVEIRVDVETVKRHLIAADFPVIEEMDVMPWHYMVVARLGLGR